MLPNIKKKTNRLQDPKSRITLLVVLSLGRTSFFVFKIDFCRIAVRKFIISGVYWLLYSTKL